MKTRIDTNPTITTLLFILLITTLIACTGPEKNDSLRNQELQTDYALKIDSLIMTTSPRFFNGVILITQNGEKKYEKAYGYSNFEKKTPISIHDRFRIMSNSKQVTAVLILEEVQKGTIDLQNHISAYLPELKQHWADSVTVHQLLNMSSGIQDLEKPLLFKPGLGYHYSNPGYGLLGRIIEKVSGKSYTENANTLFQKLNLNDTYCYSMDGENPGLISSYALREGKTETVDFTRFGFSETSWNDFLPAGGVISSAYDMNKWDSKLHNGGILNDSCYQQMITPSNSGPHAVFDYDTIGYAYGLRVHDKYPVHIGHGGRGFGFVSLKFYIP